MNKCSFHRAMREAGPQRGAILVLFFVFAMLMFAVYTMTTYIGQLSETKLRLQSGLDAGVLATANHASQGVNMIAANNLSIGAAIHIAESVPILATYSSFLLAAFTSIQGFIEDSAKEFVTLSTQGQIDMANSYQLKIWNRLGFVSHIMFGSAAGTTQLNQTLSEYWLLGAGIRTTELTRLNVPGSVAIGIQTARLKQLRQMITPFIMSYQGLGQMKPKETACMSIKASEDVRTRDGAAKDFWSWFLSPLNTLSGDIAKTAAHFQKITGLIAKYSPVSITFTGCGYGSSSPILAVLQKLSDRIVGGDEGLVDLPKALRKVLETNISDSVTANYKNGGGIKARMRQQMCRPMFQSVATAIGAVSAVGNGVTAGDKFSKRYRFYLLLEQLKKEATTDSHKAEAETRAGRGGVEGARYVCWDKSKDPAFPEPKIGHIDHRDENGKEICLDLRNLDPRCPFKPYIQNFRDQLIGECKYVADAVDRWKDQTCKDFNSDGKVKEPLGETVFVDLGKQIETYLKKNTRKGRSSKPSPWEKQIGFLVVENANQFWGALKFSGVAVSPVQVNTSKQIAEHRDTICPPALRTSFAMKQDVEFCDVTLFHNLIQDKRDKPDQDNEWKDWKSGLWAMSQSSVAKLFLKQNDHSKAGNFLFWPDFYSRLNETSLIHATQLMSFTKSNKDAQTFSNAVTRLTNMQL